MSELSTLPFTEDEIRDYDLEIPSDAEIESLVDALAPLVGRHRRISVATNQPTEFAPSEFCLCAVIGVANVDTSCPPQCSL